MIFSRSASWNSPGFLFRTGTTYGHWENESITTIKYLLRELVNVTGPKMQNVIMSQRSLGIYCHVLVLIPSLLYISSVCDYIFFYLVCPFLRPVIINICHPYWNNFSAHMLSVISFLLNDRKLSWINNISLYRSPTVFV